MAGGPDEQLPYNQDSGSGTKRRKAMNAAKMTLVSTVVAAAFGLVLDTHSPWVDRMLVTEWKELIKNGGNSDA